MMTLPEFEKKQIIFVFLSQGEKISFNNDNLVVKDKDGVIKLQTTCFRIFMLCVIGSFTLTSGIIQRSHKFGFPIFLMTASMRVYDKLGSKMEGNVILRRKQYCYQSLDLAKFIIKNKLCSQLALLKTIRQKSEKAKSAILSIECYIQQIKDVDCLSNLLGIEGNCAKIYFKTHFDSMGWIGRKPRIKCDLINATLDIGYTILFNFIETLLDIYGFDVYCGVLHKEFYMRKSLVCDLMEPFRPLIDFQVKKSINLGEFKEKDFSLVNGKYLLKWNCNAKYVKKILEIILSEKNQIFSYVQSYYRSFMKGKEASQFTEFEWRLQK
ncbi:MAG: type V CRISPR-associated endonuclease Cas1 [Succinivibrio sp.]